MKHRESLLSAAIILAVCGSSAACDADDSSLSSTSSSETTSSSSSSISDDPDVGPVLRSYFFYTSDDFFDYYDNTYKSLNSQRILMPYDEDDDLNLAYEMYLVGINLEWVEDGRLDLPFEELASAGVFLRFYLFWDDHELESIEDSVYVGMFNLNSLNEEDVRDSKVSITIDKTDHWGDYGFSIYLGDLIVGQSDTFSPTILEREDFEQTISGLEDALYQGISHIF